MKRPIRFQFDPEKLVHALAYFAEQGVEDLGKMKAVKLLFIADKYHLIKYGRPVLGDQYACMEYGPVPSFSYNVINDALAGDVDSAVSKTFTNYLQVRPGANGHPTFSAVKSPDMDVFSESDVEALRYALASAGGKTAAQLSRESHLEPAWLRANSRRGPGGSAQMDYRDFFTEADRNMLEQVEREQEDRDFAEALSF